MMRLAKTLRVFIRILLSIALMGVLAVAGLASWFFFYTSDLPDTSAMAVYSPSGVVVVSTTICGETVPVVAIPGSNPRTFRLALFASEGEFDPRSLVRRYYDEIRANSPPQRYGHYSEQLARQMLCGRSGGALKRSLAEMRTSVQLDRRFSHDQLVDIYLNRACFGSGIYGVEEASRRYFGKHAAELSIGEAALLAGLIRGPARFSPMQHPVQALARRNEVIDAMARQGSITAAEAETSENTRLETPQH
jgi:penicillin-binding protein 1A